MSSHSTAAAERDVLRDGPESQARRKPDKTLGPHTRSDQTMSLQRAIGNQAMGRLLRSVHVQPKLAISQPDDMFEQEADRVADRVMRMPEQAIQAKSICPCTKAPAGEEDETVQLKPLTITPLVQCKEDEEEEEPLQAKSETVQDTSLIHRQIEDEEKEQETIVQTRKNNDQSSKVSSRFEQTLQSMRGSGEPLDKKTRSFFESRFGYDFSQVRVNTSSEAAVTAQELNAQAYTFGRDIIFGSHKYRPETPSGQCLIAHELAHVVQQSHTGPTLQCQLITPLAPDGGFGGQMGRDRRQAMSLASASLIDPIVAGGYVTYPIPVEGNQQFILQFAQGGAQLRFKSSRDSLSPQETPIPAGAAFAPVLSTLEPGHIVVGLGDRDRKVDVRYAAGRRIEHYEAINPEEPFGPLRIGQEFSVHFVEAIITHPGGVERYSFKEELPDEAIAEPTWVSWVPLGMDPRTHPENKYRAGRGRYEGRTVTINYGEIATLRGFEEGAIASAKFMAELGLYAIPYVGPLILVGQALAGRTIWGERLSTEGRVLYGLFALLPMASRLRGATGTAAELTAARELAASRGIAESEALGLIRGLRTLSAEERSFIETAEAQLRASQALSETQARRLAGLLNRIGAQTSLIFSAANDIELIWQSQRYWGMTEGAVYGARIPADTVRQRLMAMISEKEGMVVFQGDAARLFHAHEIEGGYSALKRLLGQHKAGFGDLVFDEAIKEGKTIIVTRAHIATMAEIQHVGQTTSWATARLWGRRLALEPVAAAGTVSTGYMVYMLFDWLRNE